MTLSGRCCNCPEGNNSKQDLSKMEKFSDIKSMKLAEGQHNIFYLERKKQIHSTVTLS